MPSLWFFCIGGDSCRGVKSDLVTLGFAGMFVSSFSWIFVTRFQSPLGFLVSCFSWVSMWFSVKLWHQWDIFLCMWTQLALWLHPNPLPLYHLLILKAWGQQALEVLGLELMGLRRAAGLTTVLLTCGVTGLLGENLRSNIIDIWKWSVVKGHLLRHDHSVGSTLPRRLTDSIMKPYLVWVYSLTDWPICSGHSIELVMYSIHR